MSGHIKCPKCGSGHSLVKDSRASGKGVRRRRKCGDCDHTYATFEQMVTPRNRLTNRHKLTHAILDELEFMTTAQKKCILVLGRHINGEGNKPPESAAQD